MFATGYERNAVTLITDDGKEGREGKGGEGKGREGIHPSCLITHVKTSNQLIPGKFLQE